MESAIKLRNYGSKCQLSDKVILEDIFLDSKYKVLIPYAKIPKVYEVESR